MAPLEPALVEADWSMLAAEVGTMSRQRSLVVLFTPLEPAAVEEGLLPTLAALTRHHRVVLASVADPALSAMTADVGSARQVYDAAAAERTVALRERTAAGAAAPGRARDRRRAGATCPSRSPTTTCC